ncbi:hypothetical protein ACEPAH_297 [Sanghuangporus vaninii]
MQNSDEDLASIIARWTPARARFRRSITNTRGSDQEPARSLLQDSTEGSESNNVQTTSENTSPDLTDTFSRLQQIRSALSYLEESIVRADRIEGQATATAPQIPTSNAETGIGPSHSAIVLSEEDNPTPRFESLRERLLQIERNLPEVMHATTDMIQILARTRQDVNRTEDTTSSASPSDGSTSLPRQPESAAATSPRNRTSDAVPGRTGPLRPVREFNRSAESNDGLLRSETRTNQEVRPAHTLPAWRVAHRDDDSPSTLLGRRVASRAAARSSGSSTSDQRRRAIPPSTVFWQSHWQGQNDPSVGIPHRAGMSRVVIPARLPERVSRRIAQFESAASERQRHEDSDGSETEVDRYVYRRPIVRRLLHDNGRSERIQRQMDPDGRPQNPLGFVTISPSSSVGGTISTGPSSSDASPQQTEEERPPAATSRMQNGYGYLNRLSSGPSDAPSSLGPSSSSTGGGDLDGALFSRTARRRREGDDLYHEVIDEEEGRSYRILRRLNADGDEQVHQLNSDPWTDDPFGPTALAAIRGAINGETEQQFLSAAQANATNMNGGTTNSNNSNAIPSSLDRLRRSFNIVRQTQQSETDLPPLITDSPSLNTNMTTRRRRGWARLDANGDEIPTDEEEEIDRILTAQRIRTNQGVAWRSSTNASSSSSAVLRTRLEYLAPTTRSVFSHATDDDEDDENTSDIRVRLGIASALPSRRFAGPTPRFNIFSDAWKEKEKEREPEQEFFGTSEPYFVRPIPMFLEDRDLASSGASRSESYNTRKGLAELREKAVAGL